MTLEKLELAEFERLLDVHGSELERWPELERRRAHALLERSEPARAALGTARRLTAVLDALPTPEPSAALRARLMTLPARESQRRSFWPALPAFGPLLAWGTAAMLGLFIGRIGGSELDPFLASFDSVAVSSEADPSAGEAIADEAPSSEEEEDWGDAAEDADWSELALLIELAEEEP